MKTNKKDWGVEIVWAENKLYAGRTLIIKEGEQTPFLYHRERDVTICVLQGVVSLALESRTKLLQEGDSYHLLPRVMYGMAALKGDATILEAGTQLLTDEVMVKK